MTLLGTIAGKVRDPATVARPQSTLPTFTHFPDAIYNYGTIAGQVRRVAKATPGGTFFNAKLSP